METLQSMDPDILEEIGDLFEKIENKELEHDQRYVHCGTAHCVCGWVAYLDLLADEVIMPNMILREPRSIDALESQEQRETATELSFRTARHLQSQIRDKAYIQGKHSNEFILAIPEAQYTADKWNLTYAEVRSLFGPYQHIEDLIRTLTLLEQGKRLVTIRGRDGWAEPDTLDQYNKYGRRIHDPS
jgi:hypothetical protein